MPYKHQAHCYRTFNGVQYMNQCDVLDEEHRQLVAKAKRLKLRHRVVKHQDGYGQLFVHPDDALRLVASEYKADFLFPHKEGSVEEAGYEFANAKTPEYQRQWWEILKARLGTKE